MDARLPPNVVPNEQTLSAMVELAAGLGHMINPVLTVISGRAQLLLRDESDAERKRALGIIHAQALRIHDMIADLMLFARPPKMQPEPIDLATLLAEIVARSTLAATAKGVELRVLERDKPLTARGDRNLLTTAFTAILDNALRAAPRDSVIEIELAARSETEVTSCGETSTRDEAVVTFRDEGSGLDPYAIEHAFDPFYAGHQAGRGLGLGLSKAWRFVAMHSGTIAIKNRRRQDSPSDEACPGAEVSVRLLRDEGVARK